MLHDKIIIFQTSTSSKMVLIKLLFVEKLLKLIYHQHPKAKHIEVLYFI